MKPTFGRNVLKFIIKNEATYAKQFSDGNITSKLHILYDTASLQLGLLFICRVLEIPILYYGRSIVQSATI